MPAFSPSELNDILPLMPMLLTENVQNVGCFNIITAASSDWHIMKLIVSDELFDVLMAILKKR